MAGYITLEEFETLATATSTTLSSLSDDKKEASILAVSRIADGYLRTQYTLPLTSYGEDLKQIIADMAAYHAIAKRGFNPANPEYAILRQTYEDAESKLRMIPMHKFRLAGIEDESTDPDDKQMFDAAIASSDEPSEW